MRRRRRGPSPESEAGFVLPAVLAILVIVSGAAVVTAERLRSRAAFAGGQARAVRLQGLADGAARLVATALVFERNRGVPGLGLPQNGTTVACALGGGRRIVLSLQDHAGLIDLNASPRALIEAALRALGIDATTTLTLAAEIVDYRDTDEMPEPNGGAEKPQYRSRGLAHGPRDAPFASVDEIDRLPSMTPDLARRLRPAFTVYNPGGGIDPAQVPVRALVESVAGAELRQHAVRSTRQYVEVRVSASDGAVRVHRSAMLSTGGTGAGTRLLSWQPDGPDLPGGVPHPVCPLLATALVGEPAPSSPR